MAELDSQRVVITASELDQPAERASIPWWGYAAGGIMVLAPGLLAVASIVLRVALRKHERQRVLWTGLLATLLSISTILTSAALTYVWFTRTPQAPEATQLPLGLLSHDLAASFPSFPAAAALSSVDIAAQTKLLVLIVAPHPERSVGADLLASPSIGAAVLLSADEHGYLAATNQHVIQSGARRALVVSSQGSQAGAEVAGRHKQLDLALLWIPRRSGRSTFHQPLARNPQVGTPVFVIGHPERLYFTLSAGMISRIGEGGVLQLSAPISPGNSGGPAYDAMGNLTGVVTSTIDKQWNPNAENLNFATGADALSRADGWDVRGEGKAAFERYIAEERKRTNENGLH